MSLNGNAAADSLLRGKINKLDVITLDTYRIALKNGFEGTVEEWLASLVGPQGDPGVYVGSGEMPDGYTVQFNPDGEYIMEAPKIVDGVWWLWDDETGEYVNSGVSATGPKGDKGDQGDPGILPYVTPQMFGAVGDGVTDDTAAFVAAQDSEYPVYVPLGSYVVNDFDFSKSKEWRFQRSNNRQWFTDGTTILTSTGITVSAGPTIYNMVLRYNGGQSIENRPAGVRMKAHFCEIHGLHVMGFYVGMDFGDGAGGHSDYCKIYDLYAWYNHFCGVRLAGSAAAQVNFISFFDCNVGSNGVDVHDKSVQPDTGRGYGFYLSLANSVYINNADVSSNETCGIYIDNAVTTNVVRGFVVDTIYAEHNKFCNIYFRNGTDSSSTVTRCVDIRNSYFYNDATDLYFRQDVYMECPFIPPTVSFGRIQPNVNLPDCYSPDIDMTRSGARKTPFTKFYGRSGNSYKLTLTVRSDDISGTSDKIVFQNLVEDYSFDANGTYFDRGVSLSDTERMPAFTVEILPNTEKTFTVYVTLPKREGKLLLYNAATYTTGGATWYLVDGKVENITPSTDLVTYGTPPNGAISNINGVPLIYANGEWVMLQTNEAGVERSYTNQVPLAQDFTADAVFNEVGFKNNVGISRRTNEIWEYPGYALTGIMEYVVPNSGLPPVMYIKGVIDFNDGEGFGMGFYAAGKTYKGGTNVPLGNSSIYFNATQLGENYYKLEPKAGGNGRSPLVDNMGAGIVGVSFGYAGTGYGLIVSFGDPIE